MPGSGFSILESFCKRWDITVYWWRGCVSVDEIYPSVFSSLVSEYKVDISVVEGVMFLCSTPLMMSKQSASMPRLESSTINALTIINDISKKGWCEIESVHNNATSCRSDDVKVILTSSYSSDDVKPLHIEALMWKWSDGRPSSHVGFSLKVCALNFQRGTLCTLLNMHTI